MSIDKPKKRLVHKRRYVWTMLEKGGLYSFALGFGMGGCIFLLISLVLLWMGAPPWDIHDPDDMDKICWLVWGGLFGGLSLASTWFGVKLFKAAHTMEPVALVTRHNTGLLPEVETLVRGSNRTETVEQAELLRAVRQCSSSPPEQLLRAAQESRQDV